MTRDAPWLRVETDESSGQWHMPVGDGPDFVLAACDRELRDAVDEREVGSIPVDARCAVCQDVYRAREAPAAS